MTPGDRCQCPHRGVLLKGRLRIEQVGVDDIIQQGDAFNLPPGHTVFVEEDCECIEFSPTGLHQQAMETVLKNAGPA